MRRRRPSPSLIGHAAEPIARAHAPVTHLPIVLNNRGVAAERDGKLGEARTCYEEALKCAGEPHRWVPLLRNNLASVLLLCGEPDRAREQYGLAIAAARDQGIEVFDLAEYRLGDLEIAEGRYEEAVAHLEIAITNAEQHGNRPDALSARSSRAYLEMLDGRASEAVAVLREAFDELAEGPHTYALFCGPNLAKALEAAGQMTAIPAVWERLAALASELGRAREADHARNQNAIACLHVGEVERATELAADLAPDGMAQTWLALASGDRREALARLRASGPLTRRDAALANDFAAVAA